MGRRKIIMTPEEEQEIKRVRREKQNELRRNRRRDEQRNDEPITCNSEATAGPSNLYNPISNAFSDHNYLATQPLLQNIVVNHDVHIANNNTGNNVINNVIRENYIGQMNVLCMHCTAKHFKNEMVANKGNSFNDCCHHGEVKLDPLPDFPIILKSLFESTHEKSKNFFERIRNFNSSFSFASFNANLVDLSAQRRGPYCFKIQGQIYYQMNTSLYPSYNESPSYGQLFIVDSAEAVDFRAERNAQCDREILVIIEEILRTHNKFVMSYQMMKDILDEESVTDASGNIVEPDLNLVFTIKPGMDVRRYNYQRANEVAAVFSTTADGGIPESYVTVRNKNTKTFQRVTSMDPNSEPWIYPLFFPHGNQGWHRNIYQVNRTKNRVTRSDYFKYRLAIRDEFNVFLMGRRLTQQWIVDSYVNIERDRLQYDQDHQSKLRAESYQGLLDHLQSQLHNDASKRIGKVMILPSTFTGSPRNMLHHYQDAMAIVRKFHKPDLFITMTCNPKWREISENLLPGQTASDRPDLVARKRGLPHLHMLITLDNISKMSTPERVNKFISAEIPDKNEDPTLHNIVTTNMLHGPCGDWCLVNDKCSKRFPKDFQSETLLDANGYPSYRRRNNGITFTRNQSLFDNQHVVPYNATLLLTFNCHINVEVVSTVSAVKYLYKYVYKGHDKAGITINGQLQTRSTSSVPESNGQSSKQSESHSTINHDEIKNFVDTRYVGPVEGAWRILCKNLQDKSHSVIRLPVHLPNEQNITISDDCDENGLIQALQKRSMLIKYFSLNERDPLARRFIYSDIPYHYTFSKKKGSLVPQWHPRQRCFNVIGRMYSVSPAQSELFHLRILLLHSKEARNYEELRTVNGVIHNTFTETCLAAGLIEDDDEWKRTLSEAVISMMPRELRCLFVRILIHCQPLHPNELRNEFKEAMSEDFTKKLRSSEQGQKKAYIFINSMLHREGYSLASFPSMPQISEIENIDVTEQDVLPETANHSNYDKLNIRQKGVVNYVLSLVDNNHNNDVNSNCIFIDRPDGSGKTFIYTTLCELLKDKNKNVCTMAYTGIAATLLPNGKTVHKTFGLPVPMFSDSSSNVKPNSKHGIYLSDVDVFIWDEAPMSPRYALEIVNRTLQDIMNNYIPFGGKIMILGGDFRQLLPVQAHATRTETINLSIKFSSLWKHFRTFSLQQNMRALPEEKEFVQFLLDIGNGKINDIDDKLVLPNQCLVSTRNNIITDVYQKIIRGKRYHELTGTAILSARNIDVDAINQEVIKLLDISTEKIYTAVDSTENCDNGDFDDAILTEYLNTLNPPNIAPYELRLRQYAIVMLIRNLSLSEGLCNGTRLMIIQLGTNV
ncbi:uncharacterized protein LOC123273764 [Cotesia glomerata]|uniref:uncharacterized protein LOC123273764 n=1 Tax=Cotesia glomerata TaxID=32391 RepID=UPI001D00A068|nr:uncharacterized protein LOC123273764 [Cotesia glomerata]